MRLNTARWVSVGVAVLVVLAGLGVARQAAQAQTAKQAPIFEVDPFWPGPLPKAD